MSAPATPPHAKFRGATVEDLDLPPALSITPSTPIPTALSLSYDRDYSQLTVIDAHTRALLGYVTTDALQEGAKAGIAEVGGVMSRFRRKGRVYRVITPATTLEELWEFLHGKEAAEAVAGEGGEKGSGGEEFAVVTDEGRRFVLGVATRGDLDAFVARRGVM